MMTPPKQAANVIIFVIITDFPRPRSFSLSYRSLESYPCRGEGEMISIISQQF
jgi:hypothetical protein